MRIDLGIMLAGRTSEIGDRMNAEVDAYLERSTQWPGEMRALRSVLVGRGLEESLKWGKPCFSSDGRNIAIMQEMKGFLALMFFKGALLPDPAEVLEAQGPNSRSAMRVCFRSVDDVERLSAAVATLVDEAVAVEAAGLSAPPAPVHEPCPELQARLDADPELAAAFASLTPGRRREYDLHVAQAKRAQTRESRIDKAVPRILAGRGLRDR